MSRLSKTDEKIKPLSSVSMMDTLRKTAAIMSAKHDVSVVFRGNRAYTDGRRIVVPSLPEDAPADLVQAIIGYVDHEVGHIRHTDFTFKKPFEHKDKRVALVTNMVEDLRQEHLISAEFRGVSYNLDQLCAWTSEKLIKNWDELKPFAKLLMLSMARAFRYEGRTFKPLPEGSLKDVLDLLDENIRSWATLPDTQASYAKALEFLDILNKLSDPEDDGEGGEGGGEGEDKDKDGKKSKSGSKSKPKKAPADEDGEAEEDEGEDSAGGKKDGKESDDKGESEESGDPDGEESEDGDGDEDGGASPDGDKEGMSDFDDASDFDTPSSFSATEPAEEGSDEPSKKPPIAGMVELAKALEEEDPTFKGLHESAMSFISLHAGNLPFVRPFSTEFDRTIAPEGKSDLGQYNKILSSISEHVAVVSSVMRRSLLAKTRAKTLHGRTTGAISINNMGRLRFADATVFKRKVKGIDLDTYVELVIDQSGSMGGRKIDVATKTAIVLAESLDRVKVPFGICGFTCHFSPSGLSREEELRLEGYYDEAKRSADGTFSRIEPLIEICYKKGDEPLSKARPLFPLMLDQRMGNNADGDSLMRIAKRVAQRKEKRKLLIVVSDGYPEYNLRHLPREYAYSELRRVVKSIERSEGFDIIGIGIGTDSVAQFYTRNIVLSDISQLPDVALGKLREHLLAGI